MTIDMEKALNSIDIEISAMQGLARSKKNRVLLESYGIDTCNFDPVVSVKIDMVQWVKILLFYKRECNYLPARIILANLKRIISAGEMK